MRWLTGCSKLLNAEYGSNRKEKQSRHCAKCCSTVKLFLKPGARRRERPYETAILSICSDRRPDRTEERRLARGCRLATWRSLARRQRRWKDNRRKGPCRIATLAVSVYQSSDGCNRGPAVGWHQSQRDAQRRAVASPWPAFGSRWRCPLCGRSEPFDGPSCRHSPRYGGDRNP